MLLWAPGREPSAATVPQCSPRRRSTEVRLVQSLVTRSML